MLSRIAESLYWIGRFVERAEDTARITDVNYHHTLEMGTTGEAGARRRRHWEALIAIVGNTDHFAAHHDEATEETVPPYLTFAADNANSIVSCIALARENARTMRHQIASEMWEVINRFHLDLQAMVASGRTPVDEENVHAFYQSVKEFSHLFQGITDSTMPREEGWYFLQVGRFLERAEKTARALDVKYHLLVADADPSAPVTGPAFARAAAGMPVADGAPGDWHQWLAMLRSLTAYEAYHKIYRSAVRPRSVIEMLVLSPVFPRSIRFSIGQVDEALGHISSEQRGGSGEAWDGTPLSALGVAPNEAKRAVGRLHGALAYQRVDELFASGLHDQLVDIQRQCYRIGERIDEEYFAHRVMRAEEVA